MTNLLELEITEDGKFSKSANKLIKTELGNYRKLLPNIFTKRQEIDRIGLVFYYLLRTVRPANTLDTDLAWAFLNITNFIYSCNDIGAVFEFKILKGNQRKAIKIVTQPKRVQVKFEIQIISMNGRTSIHFALGNVVGSDLKLAYSTKLVKVLDLHYNRLRNMPVKSFDKEYSKIVLELASVTLASHTEKLRLLALRSTKYDSFYNCIDFLSNTIYSLLGSVMLLANKFRELNSMEFGKASCGGLEHCCFNNPENENELIDIVFKPY